MIVTSPTPQPLHPSEVEVVQSKQNQNEYTLLGSFARTRGLALFALCPQTNKPVMLKPVNHGMATLQVNPNGSLEASTSGITGQVNIANIALVFEALNMASAQKRIDKFLAGKITQLNNLRPAPKPLHITDFI